MARRRLYGAAAAAHAKKQARTALARRGTTAVVAPRRRRSRTRYVRVGRRRRRSASIGGAAFRSLKGQLWDLGSSAAYGYATVSTGADTAKTVRDYLAMLPTVDAIGKPASHGLLFHFAASFTSGTFRRVFGHLSHAALMRAAYNFGANEFDFEKTIKVAGDDDVVVLSGEIEDDEIGDDDVE